MWCTCLCTCRWGRVHVQICACAGRSQGTDLMLVTVSSCLVWVGLVVERHGTQTMTLVFQSQDNVQESVLAFYHVSSGFCSQVHLFVCF